MKKKNNETTYENSEIIKESIKPFPHIEIEGNTSVMVEGVKSVLEYDSDKVRIGCGMINIGFSGEKLLLINIAEDRMVIGGSIIAIEFFN